jgi:hypothetical protein
MKKYLLGLVAVVLAVGFSAFTVAKKFDNTFKIVGVTTIDNQQAWLTDDASADDPGDITCGTASNKCKIQTTLSSPRLSGAQYYFLASDGTLNTGNFQ